MRSIRQVRWDPINHAIIAMKNACSPANWIKRHIVPLSNNPRPIPNKYRRVHHNQITIRNYKCGRNDLPMIPLLFKQIGFGPIDHRHPISANRIPLKLGGI